MNNALPFDVRRYLYKQWNEQNVFAYISIDKLDSSMEWSENIGSLYGINLVHNRPADEQLLFLQGVYPYQESQPLILDEVNFATNRSADIHIVPSRYKLCILLFDVTYHVQTHQKLQQKRNELKLLYEQEMRSIRTLRQSFEELKRQKELAETAHRSKSEFIQHISRDLKSPLNGILGFAQLLEMFENQLPDDALEYVQEIRNSGGYLLSMIDKLLDISETKNESLQHNPEIVSASNLLNKTIESLNSMAKAKNIDFINRLDENLPLVSIDSVYFQQIVSTLLSNAIKYSRENGCIVISAYITSNDFIHLSIKDTGVGIGTEYLPYLFQPRECEGIENLKAGQSGASLSLCKSLTELMRGTIGVYSDVGIGSLFWLEIPSAKKSPAKIKPNKSLNTILYIEDNQTYLFLMNCFVEQYHGCSLLNAKNVVDVFELINAHPVSVILLDADTFEETYLDIFQALQSHEKSKNIPVIALFNTDAEPGKIKQALNAGFYDYLIKPFDFNLAMELFDRLTQDNS